MKFKLRALCKLLTNNRQSRSAKYFELAIITVIILNSLIIGYQISKPFGDPSSDLINYIDDWCLGIFTIEFIIRAIAKGSIKKVFKNSLLIFDFIILMICFIPESLVQGLYAVTVLRTLRIFRIIRIINYRYELKTIIFVLLKSLMSLLHVACLLLIYIYVFAVISVCMFKLPQPEQLNPELRENLIHFQESSNNYYVADFIDPYGTVPEAMFSLFKTVTGDDWTNLRNQQILASELGLIKVPQFCITGFHILWFFLGAYLLINLFIGAIVDNYQNIKNKENEEREHERIKKLIKESLDELKICKSKLDPETLVINKNDLKLVLKEIIQDFKKE